MPSTAGSTTEEIIMVDDEDYEESLEEMRTTAENQESEFEDFMHRMGYDVSSLLEKACPALVKNPNKTYGPKSTSTPNHTISFEKDWSISSISDCEEIYIQGMYLGNSSSVEEPNHQDIMTTCTWETLESTRTRTESSKPTSMSFASELVYNNVELNLSRTKSMHSLSAALDPTPTETMIEEETCNTSMENDASNTVLKININQEEPVVTCTFTNLFMLNLQPRVRLERLKSEELDKYMHPKKSQSELDVQLQSNTDANSNDQTIENSQKPTHSSRNDASEIQVPPKEKDFTPTEESVGVSVNNESTEDTFQQKFIQSLENIDSSVSETSNFPVKTTGTKQQLHRRIITSSDFLTPLQRKIQQEKNKDSNLFTATINCSPVKKRKISVRKENVTNNEITKQLKGKTQVQLTTPSSNEVEKKTLVALKNKKQLVFPKQLKMLESKIKTQNCTNNDPVDQSKEEIIDKIYKSKMAPSLNAIKPKKAVTISGSQENASPSAIKTEMEGIGTADVPITTENSASLNSQQNVKMKKNKSTAIGGSQENASPSATKTEMEGTGASDVPITTENSASLNSQQNVKPEKNKSTAIGGSQENASPSAAKTEMEGSGASVVPKTTENVKMKKNKSTTIGGSQENASPSAAKTEMEGTGASDVPKTTENVKMKKNKSKTIGGGQEYASPSPVETEMQGTGASDVPKTTENVKMKKNKSKTIGGSQENASPSAVETEMEGTGASDVPKSTENVKPKKNKSTTIGGGQENASPSAVETEMEGSGASVVPITTENMKMKKNKSKTISGSQENASPSAVETEMEGTGASDVPKTTQNVKTSTTIGGSQEGASSSVVKAKRDDTDNQEVPMTIENAAGPNIPQNVMTKKNKSIKRTLSVQSEEIETDFLAKSSRTKGRYRIIYLGPSVIRVFENAKPDILGKRAWNKTSSRTK